MDQAMRLLLVEITLLLFVLEEPKLQIFRVFLLLKFLSKFYIKKLKKFKRKNESLNFQFRFHIISDNSPPNKQLRLQYLISARIFYMEILMTVLHCKKESGC